MNGGSVSEVPDRSVGVNLFENRRRHGVAWCRLLTCPPGPAAQVKWLSEEFDGWLLRHCARERQHRKEVAQISPHEWRALGRPRAGDVGSKRDREETKCWPLYSPFLHNLLSGHLLAHGCACVARQGEWMNVWQCWNVLYWYHACDCFWYIYTHRK